VPLVGLLLRRRLQVRRRLRLRLEAQVSAARPHGALPRGAGRRRAARRLAPWSRVRVFEHHVSLLPLVAFARSRMSAATRSALRRVLRAAAAHDKRPELKALLPLTAPGVELSLDAPEAAPLRLLASHALRAPHAGGGLTALRDVATMLETNLRRGRVYAAKIRDEERRSLRAAPSTVSGGGSPNLAWFFSRLDVATRRSPPSDEARAARASRQKQRQRAALAQARAAAGAPPLPAARAPLSSAAAIDALECPLSILRQMVAVRVVPPRRMVVLALTSLATSGVPGDYERALSCLWFLELATPHVACTTCVDALVQGALDVSPPPPPHGPHAAWRALSVAEALQSTCGLLPSSHVVNRLLEACARAAGDARTLQRCKAAITRFAATGTPILEDVSVALLRAAERLGDLHTALLACRQVRKRNGTLPAELLVAMREWCLSEGDAEGAAWVQAELARARAEQSKPPEGTTVVIEISTKDER
jgi:hypothetical protein